MTNRRGVVLLWVLSSVVFLVFSFWGSVVHDYRQYLQQWEMILKGENPWLLILRSDPAASTYGPAFFLFAPLIQIHEHLPRLLFTFIYTAFTGGCVLRMRFSKITLQEAGFLFFLLLNPFFFYSIARYGQFDIVPSLLIVLSVVLFERKKESLAGFVLAIGTLFKIYPAFLFPLFVWRNKGIRKEFLLAFSFTLFVGFGLSAMFFGESTFYPFHYAVDRPSKLYSIFTFLRGAYSPLRLFSLSPNLDFLSPWLLAGGWLVLVGVHWKKNFSLRLGALAFLLLVMTFYQVGHPQFYTSLFMLLFLIFLSEKELPFSWGWVLLGFHALMALCYENFNQFSQEWVGWRDWIGLPHFVIQVFLLKQVLSSLRREAS